VRVLGADRIAHGVRAAETHKASSRRMVSTASLPLRPDDYSLEAPIIDPLHMLKSGLRHELRAFIDGYRVVPSADHACPAHVTALISHSVRMSATEKSMCRPRRVVSHPARSTASGDRSEAVTRYPRWARLASQSG
jgi:hypothetical protein